MTAYHQSDVFRAVATAILVQCFDNVPLPTEIDVDTEALVNFFDSIEPFESYDEKVAFAHKLAEMEEGAVAWLTEEGLIRVAGYPSLDETKHALTSAGIKALNKQVQFGESQSAFIAFAKDVLYASGVSSVADVTKAGALGVISGFFSG